MKCNKAGCEGEATRHDRWAGFGLELCEECLPMFVALGDSFVDQELDQQARHAREIANLINSQTRENTLLRRQHFGILDKWRTTPEETRTICSDS